MMNDRFHVAMEAFEGPLDTLLNLIEERKLSVSQISLAEVCDAYLAYVEKLPKLPLGETSQFILVASTLLLIKSRTLLPNLVLSEEERESVEELERRLARLRLIRNASKLMKHQWGRAPLVLPARAPARALRAGGPQRESVFVPSEASVKTIQDAIQRLIAVLPKPQEVAQAMVAPVIALEDVIANLKSRLTTAFKTRFSELTHAKNKQEKIVYFLATLELVRSGSISVTQEKLFEDITLSSESSEMPRYGTT